MKPANEPEPDGVVTETFPVAPPVPTTAVIWVALFTVKDAAAVPPKETAVAPVKSVPVMMMVEPLYPELTFNEVTVGAGARKAASLPIATENEVAVEDATVLADVKVCDACVAVACTHDVPLYNP